ncbi:hypothetical protein [Actinomycetospora cinnamomea]|uniref:hypothetical protein n=1 Tax=Actinomycetospora cinnamomea TaxID=663609 RepID=UPI001057CA2D|nr:hypothetical protein [Actinomycetospora cinnamomea]
MAPTAASLVAPTSSSIQVAALPGSVDIARPNVLVVLVKMTGAPAVVATSSTVYVPVTSTSTNSWRGCVPTCG